MFMPFYDFRCPTCDERFEVRRPISEADVPVSCPQGHENAKRVITTWGTGGGIRSGTPGAKTGGAPNGSIEKAAAQLARHKRYNKR